MASSGQSSELPHLVSLIKTLTIPQLKDLLRNEGLPVSGLKATLQLRIIDCSLDSSAFSCQPLLWAVLQPEAVHATGVILLKSSLTYLSNRSGAPLQLGRESCPLRCFKATHSADRSTWSRDVPGQPSPTLSAIACLATKPISAPIYFIGALYIAPHI